MMTTSTGKPRQANAHRKGRHFGWMAAAALLVGLTVSAPRPAVAQVVVMVNGLPVTALDIQQRIKLESLSQKHVSRDQALKLLIDDKLKITIGRRYGVEMSDAEVNANFAEIAKRMRQTPDQFAQTLTRSGVSATALKNRIRADTVWQQLVRGKFGASLQVSEGELNSVLSSNDKDEVGYIYTLRPVVVVVPRGSSGAVVDAKRREAEAIRSRFQSCDQGLAMARRLRDVAVRNPVRRNSAELPAPLRELLGKLEIGRLTTPEMTAQGFEMFALCDKKTTKTETAEKRQLKEKLFTQRFEREANKFLEETRRSAIIEYR
jgi:peptidyl-prolyl cis-trans isomerase SurA